MTRGRKSTWNFERIAVEYNYWHSAPEGEVEPAQVESDIRRHDSLFRRCVRGRGHSEAYFYLRLVLDGRMTEDEITKDPCPADVLLRDSFSRSTNYRPKLPQWFQRVLQEWLSYTERVSNLSPAERFPGGRDYPDRVSLSLYLMADCLRDESFVCAMKKVRAIWRMNEHDATTWFRWLHGQQERSIQRLFPSGAPRCDLLRPYEGYGQGSGGGLAEPLDDRNVRQDLAHGPYGLPVQDYKSHLRQLVRLAGGDPSEDLWQDWVEVLLWSGSRREVIFAAPDGSGWNTTWLRREFLTNAWGAQELYILFPPPTKPYVTTERALDGEVRVRVAIPSRWADPSSLGRQLRDDVLQSITRVWGAYRQLPSHKVRLRYLQELISRPQTLDGELGPLLEACEAEIERALPAEQQTGPEALRIGAGQTKLELRVREKHRKRNERARKRLRF